MDFVMNLFDFAAELVADVPVLSKKFNFKIK
jgi:hypothetical protein